MDLARARGDEGAAGNSALSHTAKSMASLKEQLQSDLTVAMRERDDLAVGTLRMALAAIRNAEVAGKEHVTLSDDDTVGVLRSEIRKRNDAAGMYADAGRDELATKERSEADVLSRYVPAELDDDALNAIVAEEVARAAEAGATGGKAMGAVIKAVRERVGPNAAGGRIADAVKAALR
jgi:uncharacterized protein YqeY